MRYNTAMSTEPQQLIADLETRLSQVKEYL